MAGAGHPVRARSIPAAPVGDRTPRDPIVAADPRGVPLPAPRGPFRLGTQAISHGWFQTPPFGWDPDALVLTRVERLGSGPAVLSVREHRGRPRATADRPLAGDERVEAGRRLARVLQLDADLAGFHASLAFDPDLARDLSAIGAGRLLAGGSLWEDAVKSICATNTSWRQAVEVIGRIGAWGDDGAFPGPEELERRGVDALRVEARAGYRARYLADAARLAVAGHMDDIDAAAAELPAGDLVGALRRIPGVGPTTAVFLAFLRGRFDAGTLVDSATRAASAERWFGGVRADDAAIRAVAAPAGTWAGLALHWATMRRWQRISDLA